MQPSLMCSYKVQAMSHWNSLAVDQPPLQFVACGSCATISTAELGNRWAGNMQQLFGLRPALTCIRDMNDCDSMLTLIIKALSSVIHISRHLATSHHHYTISNGALATKGSLEVAAKVKQALYEHRSMLHNCLCSYIAAVVQLHSFTLL